MTVIISVGMVLLFVRFLKGSNAIDVIERLTLRQFLWSLLPVTCLFVARSMRFALLANQCTKRPYRSALEATFQAYALNSILPFKLGEVWRLNKLRVMRNHGLVDATFYSIYDRAYDVLFCVIFMLPGVFLNLGMLKNTLLSAWVSQHSLMLIFASSFLVCFVLVLFSRLRVINIMGKFWHIAVSMKSVFWQMMFSSVVIWFFEYAVCEIVTKFLEIDITVVNLCFIIGFSNLFAAFIPSPGGLGAFEGAVIWLLLMLNQQTFESASTYAILVHGLLIIPVTLIGLIWLVLGLTFKRISLH